MSDIIKYRPEIDGLRAIAVTSVILFHAEFSLVGGNPISGGFLGVDVFFVISGYLISSIILRTLDDQSFSILNFYERRARRILPILFAVMLATLPLAWAFLYPQELIEYSKSLLYSIFFSSNVLFFSEDPYWAADSALKPFLHTWSLAVEEQFYVVMPVLMIVLHKYAKKALLPVLGVIIVSSLALAEWASDEFPLFSFFMLPTRMWELLAGAVLAVVEIQQGRNMGSVKYGILSSLGIVLICVSFFYLDEKTKHPSFLTLIPIAGTMLVIWFSQKDDFTTRLLSSKPLVGIGLISYGLYLWHFPFFAFGRMFFDEFNALYKIGLIVGVILITLLTHYMIEKPFRNRRRFAFSTHVAPDLLLGVIVVIAFSATSLYLKGAPMRHKDLAGRYGNLVYDNRGLQSESWKFLSGGEPKFKDLSKTQVLFIGNSHSKDVFNAFYTNRHLFTDYEFSRYGTSSDDDLNICHANKPSKFSRFVNSRLFKDADYIAIATSKPVPKFIKCWKKMVSEIEKRGKKIVLFTYHNFYGIYQQKPEKFRYLVKGNLPLLDMVLHTKGRYDLKALEKRYYSSILPVTRKRQNQLRKFAKIHNLALIDLTSVICSNQKKRCAILTDTRRKINYDGHHWTLEGAAYFGRLIHERGLFDLK